MTLVGIAAICVGGSEPVTPRKDDVVVRVAEAKAKESLGFGWSRAERSRSGPFRWMTHLEADIVLDMETAPRDREVFIDAQPFYLPWRRQIVGVYINNRFVDEFSCVWTNAFQEYSVMAPAVCWKEGANLLTLRAGYREQIGRDTRDLSLAVRRILVRPRDK